MCKHVGEFESMFLSDLDGGHLSVKESYDGLEGDLVNFSLRVILTIDIQWYFESWSSDIGVSFWY